MVITVQLPHDLESLLHAEVLSGHFATPDDAVAEIVRDYFRRKQAKLSSTPNLPEANEELGPDPLLGSMRDFADEMDEIVADAYRQRQENPPSEQDFKQQLLKCGLVVSFPTPDDPATRPAFQPITIKGEPLSNTIIRERR
jgi:Arc/MetJ-type ribon-helix-helix transcriptional regulator